MTEASKVVLISTYELGRQPFGLASPAAWLRQAGSTVTCLDLSREALRPAPIQQADFVAFYLPMHTATRLAVRVLPAVRQINPRAHLCFYGLYAAVNETYLRKLGAGTILGGEFETGLVAAVERLQKARMVAADRGREASGVGSGGPIQPSQIEPIVSLARQRFLPPDRAGLPPLDRYAHLNHADGKPRIAGYTEASRGCKHLCRHCPVVPVYGGHFRIVDRDVVVEDIRRQVESGAQHITFGDPDFFNGIRHAIDVVTALKVAYPGLTYDATIKIEHLLKHAGYLRTLRDTGCLFVTSAVEAVDDAVLERLDKGHTYADFVAAVDLCRHAGLVLSPTFVAFTPWTTLEGYCELLGRVAELGLVENVASIQLAIRLLIPAGSRLLELREVQEIIGAFDESGLVYPWANPDPRVDELYARIQRLIERTPLGDKSDEARQAIFEGVWELAHRAAGRAAEEIPQENVGVARAAIPYLTEPWYC